MNEGLSGRLQLTEHGPPAYRQLADQLAALIRDGELPPGERLPPDRTLARELGLSRTTVVSAYEELKAAGLVHGRQGSGTFVARPHGPANGWHGQGHTIRTSATLPAAERPIVLAQAMPPPETLPLATIVRLLGEVAEQQPTALTDYLPAEGYPPLRHELARWLSRREAPVRPAEVLVVAGSQQGLDLLARLLLRPGDYVAVESHTYSGALAAFRAAGARPLPIPIDDDGMRVEGLASLLERYPVRCIYTMPTFHNPTGAVLPLARRLAVLEAARRQAVPIIEDCPFDHVYYDDQPPPPPLKALDREGLVIHVSSASKLIGGGLRLGWLIAPPAMIDQLATLKRAADLHTNNLAQVAFQRFLAQGLVEPHLATLRQVCQRRATIMLAGLRRHLPELTVQPPRGGLYLWGRLPDGLSAEAVLDEAHGRGVTFMPGSWHSVNGCDDGHLRLCYTAPPLDLLDDAVVRLAAAVRAVANRGAPARLEQLNSQPAVV